MLAYRRMLGLSLLTVVLLGLAVSTEGTGPNTTSFQNIPSTSGQFPGKMYNSKLGENFEDDEDNSEGGSADWGTNTRNRMKEGPQDGSSTDITIIVCSLVGLVVLLIAVAVLVKHLTKPSERGDYALSPRTAE
ncbi:uncharacterized protein [Ambystoma mexicanum]|uniref:uncharacterized protein isoform X9 n=1 Tax=Ambystoma mexicanum TaxID=8296 RepID=UPI0037E9C175